jgi:hypothetical protein
MQMKKWGVGIGILVVLMVAGYTIADRLVRNKVAAALGAMPDSLHVGYASIHVNLFTGSVIIDSLHGRGMTIDRLGAHGIKFLTLLRTHRLSLSSLRLEGFKSKELSMTGTVTVDSLSGPADSLGLDDVRFGAVRADLDRLRYVIPESDEIVLATHLELDSRKKLLRLDTLRIMPMLDRQEIGRKQGHQVDVAETTSEGIEVEGLETMELLEHRLVAGKITIHSSHIRVFRDRRLPLAKGEKELPVQSLKALPVSLRVGSVEIGPTLFAYEEYPAKGDRTGTLKIYRMSGTITPLINHPLAGDPAYITVRTEGSLMNSGSVAATTKMPLHAGDPYLVEGAFHELDVTKLNDPAENLGKLHLESGMLNFLSFRFEMTTEKATGQIVGEYHDLVVDKLKDNGREAKLKSFALKKFIIPRDKDKSLPEKKRTGKVDYKRDPQRYFSYYLLHSLLVGVKSSFSLGFLLPG